MTEDELKVYKRLSEKTFRTSLGFSKLFLENKESATPKEELGAHLLILFHLLYLLKRNTAIDFTKAYALLALEFNNKFLDLYLSLKEEMNANYPTPAEFFMGRFKDFIYDYEATLERNVHLGPLSFHYFFRDPFFKVDIESGENTMILIDNINRDYREKINDDLSRRLKLWDEKTIPIIISYAFESE